MSEQDKLVLRVARIFGECELDMPPDFVTEVNKYIKLWQGSGRMEKAINKARANNYTTTITQQLLAEGLPPQFFYLALVESDFEPFISGPETRKGYAKGMWQFIPDTAVKYGLHLGPLVDLPRPDTLDDRHNYQKETVAASHYLKDLYGSDAQGSGLLVMACYNWGEDYVLPLVRSMPANPRDRNFWMLLQNHRDKIPKETYDYVFYIVSAAVIGENPRLYGFNFDNPLANVNPQAASNGKLHRWSGRRSQRAGHGITETGLGPTRVAAARAGKTGSRVVGKVKINRNGQLEAGNLQLPPQKRSEGETTSNGRSEVVVGFVGDAGTMRNGDGQTASHEGIRNSSKGVESPGEVMVDIERPLVEGARAGSAVAGCG
jgi:hypothetical protein